MKFLLTEELFEMEKKSKSFMKKKDKKEKPGQSKIEQEILKLSAHWQVSLPLYVISKGNYLVKTNHLL